MLSQLGGVKANKSLWLIVVIVILIVATMPAYYYYDQYKKTQALLTAPSTPATAELKDVVDKVGKLIELPSGEPPTLATVSDVSKLKDQPFFANAKNGDKVLIFAQTKEAILYRESINKIIQVAPVNLGSAASVSASLTSSSPTPAVLSVAIYNGTTVIGLAAKATNTITQGMPNASIAQTGDAKGNYAKTQVVDLSGKQAEYAAQIAKLLNGSVAATLPKGETKTETDILVILGTDFVK